MRMLLISRRESSRPSMYIWCRRLLCQPICEPWKFQNQYRQLPPARRRARRRLEAVGVARRVVLVDLGDVEVDLAVLEIEARVHGRVVELEVLEIARLEPVEVQVVVREHRAGSRLADHVQIEQPALQVEVLRVRPGRHDAARSALRTGASRRSCRCMSFHEVVPESLADAGEALCGADAPCDGRLEHADLELLRARGFRRRIEAHARCRRAITRAVVAQDAGSRVVASRRRPRHR